MKRFLSYALDENTPTYGNRDKFTITQKGQILSGDGANTSTWNFTNNHLGTHIDTPYHFIESGKKTLDYTAEDFCFNNIHIIENLCHNGDLISLSNNQIKNIPKSTDFLIIKTGYGVYRLLDKYHNDNPGLESDLANLLKVNLPELRAIGFDFISLTSWNFRDHGRLSHRSFLGAPNNFLIVEDMDLVNIDKSTNIKSLILAPLRTIDGNGGPVTIIVDIDEK